MKNKILIISHNPFSKISNNGKTLEAIFSKFTKEEIIQLYFVEDKLIDENYASSYFKITDNDIFKSLLNMKTKDTHPNLNGENRSNTFIKWLKKNKHSLAYLRDLLWKVYNPHKDKKLIEWLVKHNPDFIFFVAGNQIFAHEITRSLARKMNINFAVFFTDDYILYPQRNNLLKKLQYQNLIRTYKKTISEASLCFSIGDLMSNEYEKKFTKQFHPIMNMIKIGDVVENINDKFTIAYFGGLHLNRWKMLIEFGNELDCNEIDLNVYTASDLTPEISDLFLKNNINFKGYIGGADLELAMASSDALIHVESDDLINKSLTKLSVSTKIPEYLNTGKLVIGYGPSDVASMLLLSENKVGIVIENKNDIKKTLQIFIKDKYLINEYSNRARNFVKQNFDIDKNSAHFRALLEKEIE